MPLALLGVPGLQLPGGYRLGLGLGPGRLLQGGGNVESPSESVRPSHHPPRPVAPVPFPVETHAARHLLRVGSAHSYVREACVPTPATWRGLRSTPTTGEGLRSTPATWRGLRSTPATGGDCVPRLRCGGACAAPSPMQGVRVFLCTFPLQGRAAGACNGVAVVTAPHWKDS